MTSTFVRMPLLDVVVTTPAELVDAVAVFYPHAVRNPGDLSPAREYTIRPVGERWSLLRDAAAAGDFATPVQALFAMEYDIETTVVARCDDLIALHAGAVIAGEAACLIPGHPDTGKTTTTFNLVELGHAFLCEEVALVHPVTLEVQSFPQSLALDRDFLESTLAGFPLSHGTIVPLDGRFVRYVPGRIATSTARVERVLLPRYAPDREAGLFPLQPAEALTELLGYCFPPNRGEERLFDAVIALLEACQIERFCYGNVAQARRLLDESFSRPSHR